MRVLIPFAADRPKTRLSEMLVPAERRAFARAMLDDVLGSLDATDHGVTVLATDHVDVDPEVVVDERPLTPAVNDHLGEEPTAVVMADLALATPRAVDRLVAAEGDVVIAPGRGGGTNALVVREPAFRVDYHGASYRDHLAIARELDASVAVVDSHRLATDVDEPSDLVEVLLHGDGAARDWLVDAGFDLDTDDGRVSVVREGGRGTDRAPSGPSN